MPELAPGPLMVDVAGLVLTADDRARLSHPLVGGVILFGRNYESPEQLSALTDDIRRLRSLPIAIDHEGGRVQRCRQGFTRIPPMRSLGAAWDVDPAAAIATARELGYLLAGELRLCGVDLSFTPVLDLDWGRSAVIGDRSFHRRPEAVIALAGALIAGLRAAGMGAVGKHFPGHGFVEADSHLAIPVDQRTLEEMADDLAPFAALDLDGVMPAHVIYPQIDSRPAGFSPVWIGRLRREMAFEGAIFSDDLSMEGASVAGDIVARADAAWSAGCDMLLVCNAPAAVDELLRRWSPLARPGSERRVAGLFRHAAAGLPDAARLASARNCCQGLA